jgi:hypothetical protein
VTIRAPFRRLMNSAASISDARRVIKEATPIDPGQVPGAAPVPPPKQ